MAISTSRLDDAAAGSLAEPLSAVGHQTISGIDTIRFVAAAWVALSHGAGIPIEYYIDKHSNLAALLFVGFSKLMFNGPLAVVVFFVVSGFCIHLPNVGGAQVDIGRFLIRRFVRIGIPLGAILGIAAISGDRSMIALKSVLWSVYCELIYYALYPILLPLISRFGFFRSITLASLLSGIILLLNSSATAVWELGALTWLYCLPTWLLGAWLAERFTATRATSMAVLWTCRFIAIIFCVFCNGLVSHSNIKIGVVWFILPFAIFCFFWIGWEIKHLCGCASPVLEKLGLASYSIYLVHNIILSWFKQNIPNQTPLSWLMLIAALTMAAGTFYFLVELPSHRLARWMGRRRPTKRAALYEQRAV